ncbi:putative Acyl-CoA synthetase family member 4 [Monocercomonoides exilis]|uniref:putative Acyl-CoA synthetase family member 4 n=1 Tax=Monocercomonoides exilis TaxID=2049356 RepID=UPI0035599537|nr:putative Acyl-CoA synthetase family member 4 [Monocercomonoides exilis]|eukprot:MONOS_8489.1-p1 / transcript=MONOS_8489.1 / gene=MONOS_8489 / organism=Monocercomonoides_exilis_PA203 / gene_product=Acyl-CoA synthetase family member 4 / transcript_product=Acyl-CoA synthetase family member 4 / location=Mono_scaffold00321:17696-21336(+) / protein_length=1178 / sequence_SO=supercontig / SO=protein_coding / is_pseudo=false
MATSGTTKKQKCADALVQSWTPVFVPLCSAYENAVSICRMAGICSDDVIALSTSPSFDPFMIEVMGAVSSGASICIIGEGERMSAIALLEMLMRSKATVWQTTPLVLAQAVEAAAERKKQGSVQVDLSSLRVVFVGGDVFPKSKCIRSFVEAFKCCAEIAFYNLYGVTEVSVWATIQRVPRDWWMAEEECRVPLGRPLYGTTLAIRRHNIQKGKEEDDFSDIDITHYFDEASKSHLFQKPNRKEEDEKKEDEEIIVGELLIGGTNRMCFVGAELAQMAMWPSGDIVEFDKSRRELHWIGRRDNQVKIRGKRMQLEDVEQILVSLQGVDCAKAIYVRNETLLLNSQSAKCSEHIAGAFVLNAAAERANEGILVAIITVSISSKQFLGTFVESEVVSAAKKRLPSHAQPDVVVVVSSFPLTDHCKVDTVRLEQITCNAIFQLFQQKNRKSTKVAEIATKTDEKSGILQLVQSDLTDEESHSGIMDSICVELSGENKENIALFVWSVWKSELGDLDTELTHSTLDADPSFVYLGGDSKKAAAVVEKVLAPIVEQLPRGIDGIGYVRQELIGATLRSTLSASVSVLGSVLGRDSVRVFVSHNQRLTDDRCSFSSGFALKEFSRMPRKYKTQQHPFCHVCIKLSSAKELLEKNDNIVQLLKITSLTRTGLSSFSSSDDSLCFAFDSKQVKICLQSAFDLGSCVDSKVCAVQLGNPPSNCILASAFSPTLSFCFVPSSSPPPLHSTEATIFPQLTLGTRPLSDAGGSILNVSYCSDRISTIFSYITCNVDSSLFIVNSKVEMSEERSQELPKCTSTIRTVELRDPKGAKLAPFPVPNTSACNEAWIFTRSGQIISVNTETMEQQVLFEAATAGDEAISRELVASADASCSERAARRSFCFSTYPSMSSSKEIFVVATLGGDLFCFRTIESDKRGGRSVLCEWQRHVSSHPIVSSVLHLSFGSGRHAELSSSASSSSSSKSSSITDSKRAFDECWCVVDIRGYVAFVNPAGEIIGNYTISPEELCCVKGSFHLDALLLQMNKQTYECIIALFSGSGNMLHLLRCRFNDRKIEVAIVEHRVFGFDCVLMEKDASKNVSYSPLLSASPAVLMRGTGSPFLSLVVIPSQNGDVIFMEIDANALEAHIVAVLQLPSLVFSSPCVIGSDAFSVGCRDNNLYVFSILRLLK